MIKKRGLSPVIATVLLIAIVIIIASIVFLWFRGITEEAVTKFDGTNVKLICEKVSFDAQYSAGTIYLSNSGNVPIFKIKAKIVGDGSFSTVVLGKNDKNWPTEGLNQGGTYSGDLSEAIGSNKIFLIPVLVGNTESGEKKSYTCEERYAKEIAVN